MFEFFFSYLDIEAVPFGPHKLFHLLLRFEKNRLHLSASLLQFLSKFLSQFRSLRSSDPTNEAWTKDGRVLDEVSRELKGLKVRFRRPGKFSKIAPQVGGKLQGAGKL